MQPCRYKDRRNRFQCSDASSSHSPWCFWHNPDQPKSRQVVEEAIARHQNLTGAWLEGIDLSGANMENVCLYGAVLRFAHLERTNLSRADLRFADLRGAVLDEAELQDALLEGCNLSGASIRKGVLRYANATGADLEGADLEEADLLSAHLMDVNLSRTNLKHMMGSMANFWKADLSNANLEQTDLIGANLSNTDFTGADLRGVKFDRSTNFVNVQYSRGTRFHYIDTSTIDPAQYPVLVKDIRDFQYLADFQRRHPRLYRVWKLSSDCGRSLKRWGALYLATGLLFGALRALFPGIIETPGPETALSPFYHAFSHFLSLGWTGGSAVNGAGQTLLLAESAAGYLLFGGLLALLFQKLARRS